MEGEEMQNAKCKMQNWDLSGRSYKGKNMFFFEKKNQKAFDQLRGKILRKLFRTRNITIFEPF